MTINHRTRFRRAEETLRESAELLERIFSTTELLIAYLDTDFTFVRVNRAYAHSAEGRDPAFFVGKNHFALYPDAENEAIFRRVVETGEPFIARARPFEYPDHPERGVTYWDWTLQPVRDAEGRVTGLMLSLVDVSAQERAAIALRESEERFRSLVEATSDWIWECDATGRYTYASPKVTELLGYEPQEILGKVPTDLMEPGEARRLAGDIRTTWEAHKPFVALENINLHKDGHRVILETSGVPVFDPRGEFRGYRGIDRDITRRSEAEEALRRSTEEIRDLYHHAPVGYHSLDADGMFVRINDTELSWLGYTRDEVVGKLNVSDVLTPGSRRLFATLFPTFKERGSLRDVELEIVRRDGSIMPVLVSATAVRDADGNFLMSRSTVWDNTERRQADEALRVSEARLRRAQSVAHIGSWALDVIHDVPTWSDETYRIFEVPPGPPLTYEAFLERVHPDDRAEMDRAWTAAFSGVPYDLEHRIFVGGETKWVRERAEIEFDAEGRVQALVGTIQDITEKKRAEQILRASEERLRAILISAPLVFWTLDPKGVFTLSMGKGLEALGLHQDEIVGRTVEEIYGDHPEIIALNHRALAGEVVSAEVRVGDLVYMSRYTPLRDDAGKIAGAIGVALDITYERRLESDLAQARKMEAIGRLAGGIAHDFNNLLTAITGYAQLLIAGLKADDPNRADVDQIVSAAERAAALVRQLLAFSRRAVLTPVVLDPNEVVAGLVPLLRRLIGEDVELVAVPAAHIGQVEADRGQLEQVIVNLVVNARDAMPDGGTVTIEAANVEFDGEHARAHPTVGPGQYVMIAVSDTGAGIEPEALEHIFEPFFTTKPEGTGLGLATVYGIVRQSGGYVWPYSEPGHGSTFKVYLPRVESDVVPQQPELPEREAAGGTETILVVEDEKAVRVFACRVLEARGYTVLAARDGQEALRLAAAHRDRIDLLVTDVVLPGMNGPQLAERLAAERSITRVLFVSGYAGNSMARHGLLGPDVAFLAKPFPPVALARAVREVLDAPSAGKA